MPDIGDNTIIICIVNKTEAKEIQIYIFTNVGKKGSMHT